jgi:hypothetical protein
LHPVINAIIIIYTHHSSHHQITKYHHVYARMSLFPNTYMHAGTGLYSPKLYVRVMLLNIHVTRIVTRILIMLWCTKKLTKYNTIKFIYLPINNVTKIYIITHQQRHQNLYNYSPITSPEFIYSYSSLATPKFIYFYSSLATPEFIYFIHHYQYQSSYILLIILINDLTTTWFLSLFYRLL